MRMFASRTIILTRRALPFSTQLFELGYQFFLIYVRQRGRKAVRRRLEFGDIRRSRSLSACGNVNPQSFAAACDGYWGIRFQEAGNSVAKLAHADLDCAI